MDEAKALQHAWDSDGGPAFPSAVEGIAGAASVCFRGMTLRDWFAGQALAGMMAAPDNNGAVWNAYAKDAYAIADAMLKARIIQETL